MPDIPNTNSAGKSLYSVGDGTNAATWGQPLQTIYLQYTYAVSGAIAVASGATNYLPPFYYPVLGGQNVTLWGVRGRTRTGSLKLDINHNGAGITGLTSQTITTSTNTYNPSSTVSVVDGDYFAPLINTITSTPDGLTLTFIFAVVLDTGS